MYPMESFEIDVAAVHHIEGTGLGNQDVEDVDVVQFSIGNVNEFRDIAAKVEQRMQLDGALGFAKPRPRKQRKAQIDGTGVERVHGVVQLDAEVLAGIQGARLGNEHLRKIRIDAPVAFFVSVGQRAPRPRAPDADLVELEFQDLQARDDLAQTLAVRQLGKGHAKELVVTGERALAIIAAIPSHTFGELVCGKKLHDLREYESTGVHKPSFSLSKREKYGQNTRTI